MFFFFWVEIRPSAFLIVFFFKKKREKKNTAMKIINLQSGRRLQLSKHRCLQGEYVDHFLQFSARQKAIGEIKTYLARKS